MKKAIVLVMTLALVGSAMAVDLGNKAADKPMVNFPPNVPGDRQGGDTILDATAISIPGTDTGTTAGYTDDYDEVCPYSGSTAPDVVYTATPAGDVIVDIDLLGSTYDTKVYVYDENLALVACNDDFYSDYVSKIEQLALMGGTQYFIVIDGWNGDFGDYVLTIVEFAPCVLECPAGAELEGEPPLVDDYVDAYNGGCNSPDQGSPFGTITGQTFCGVSGYYLFQGSQYRDTDWFEITVPADGFVEIVGDAEQETYMFELAPQDCNSVGVAQQVIIGPCAEGTITIPGAVGSTIWFWVGPTAFEGPVNEYDYVLYTNLDGVATEDHSWTGVKALFD